MIYFPHVACTLLRHKAIKIVSSLWISETERWFGAHVNSCTNPFFPFYWYLKPSLSQQTPNLLPQGALWDSLEEEECEAAFLGEPWTHGKQQGAGMKSFFRVLRCAALPHLPVLCSPPRLLPPKYLSGSSVSSTDLFSPGMPGFFRESSTTLVGSTLL